jgi:voltage-gated potassium channel
MVQPVSKRDNFIWLLGGLLFLLFSGALFAQHGLAGGLRLVNISISGALLVAVWAMEQQRGHWMRSRIGLTLIVASLMLGDVFLEDYRLTLLQLGFIFMFLNLTTFLACKQVLFSGSVDGNKIIGAICIYIMMALSWAFGYLLIEEVYPGSFTGLNHSDWHDNMQDVVYFSFVTLTTLGYGDISPVLPLARFFGYLEAVTGQFYIAILVASLIGIRLAQPGIIETPELKRRAEDMEDNA